MPSSNLFRPDHTHSSDDDNFPPPLLPSSPLVFRLLENHMRKSIFKTHTPRYTMCRPAARNNHSNNKGTHRPDSESSSPGLKDSREEGRGGGGSGYRRLPAGFLGLPPPLPPSHPSLLSPPPLSPLTLLLTPPFSPPLSSLSLLLPPPPPPPLPLPILAVLRNLITM